MKLVSSLERRGPWAMLMGVAVGVFFVVALAQAATTISTNIETAGTLNVYGISSFGGTATATISAAGVVSLPSTLSVTGLATLLGGATTTSLTLLNGEVISNATDGTVQINGIASSTSVTLLNGETVTNATDGTIALSGNLNVTTTNTATSTLTVGCIQTYATSTVTPIRMTLYASSTIGVAITNAAANNGYVAWQYGSCPI